MVPWYAQRFSSYLTNDEELSMDVDIRRFEPDASAVNR